MSPRFEIVELDSERLQSRYLVMGLPDIGAVGSIATAHMIHVMEMDIVGYIETEILPPMVYVRKGVPYSPFRIYGNEEKKVLVMISDIPIPPFGNWEIARRLLEWISSKNIEYFITLGGIQTPERLEREKPRVFFAGSTLEIVDDLRRRGLEPLGEGVMTGLYGATLVLSRKLDVKSLALLAEAYVMQPDFMAAAAVLEALEEIIGERFDISELLDRAREMEARIREQMERAEELMRRFREREPERTTMYV